MNAPNHRSTRRSPLLRASASMMSTSEKSNVPSAGSLSAQLTGESTTFEPTRRMCANESAMAFGEDEAELNTCPPTRSAGAPSRRSTNGASVERAHGREAGERVSVMMCPFCPVVCPGNSMFVPRSRSAQRPVAEVAEPRLARPRRVQRRAQAEQVADGVDVVAGCLVADAVTRPLAAGHAVPAGDDVLVVADAQRDAVRGRRGLAPVRADAARIAQHPLAVDAHAAEEPVVEEQQQAGFDARLDGDVDLDLVRVVAGEHRER